MKQEETIQVFKNYFNYIKRPGAAYTDERRGRTAAAVPAI